MSGMNGADDLLGAFIALLPNGRRGIETRRKRPASCRSGHVVDRLQSALYAFIAVQLGNVRQRHECGDGLAGALDDQALARCRLVKQLPESLPDIEG